MLFCCLSDPFLRAELLYGIKTKIIFFEITNKIAAIGAATVLISFNNAY